MAFLSALAWGTGLSLGMCVGLVTWGLIRKTFGKALDIVDTVSNLERNHELSRRSVEALIKRNELTEETNLELKRIADAANPGVHF